MLWTPRHRGLRQRWLPSIVIYAASAALWSVSAQRGSAREPVTVSSRQFAVHYRAGPSTLQLTAVVLWYTEDRGETWHRFGVDPDRQSPISFFASQEGLLGLYVVLENRHGSSAPAPSRGTDPQMWVLVDYTPPVLQFHEARVERSDGSRRVLLRWSAWDSHLGPRPIELAYRREGQANWTTFDHRLPNRGRFDWPVPGDLQGLVWLRLRVQDRGGHTAQEVRGPIDLGSEPLPDVTPSSVASTRPTVADRAEPPPRPVDDERVRQAEAIFEIGGFYLLRGELALAAQRFREVLDLNPTHLGARHDLAGILYKQGMFADAIAAYEMVLKQAPSHAGALQGLALAHIARREYGAARQHLMALVESKPNDARTWLHLGDVALMAGDPLAARAYWTKALAVDPADKKTSQRASNRLHTPAAELFPDAAGRATQPSRGRAARARPRL